VSSLHETVGLEPGVRRTHRVHVDAELTGKGADRWQALAGRELPVGDEEGDSRTNLRPNDKLSIGKMNITEMKSNGPIIRPKLDTLFLSIGKIFFFILNYLYMYNDRIQMT
jgi:hypothetical protein